MTDHETNKQKKDRKLDICLAAPRGFCAGVDRAIQIVQTAIEKYGTPVYVRHEIVHNKYVVNMLQEKGAVFVEELDEIPQAHYNRPVVFSAHGVPKTVPLEARDRQIFYIDATCPLVTKVHNEAEHYYQQGKTVILIGHRGHPEVVGTMGQLPQGAVILVENVEDVDKITVKDEQNVAFCTQTTLSVDDTAEITQALYKRFPGITGPRKEDICYATTNRQAAVKAMASKIDALMVIGAPNSSNSRRLVEVGAKHGCDKAILIQNAEEIQMPWLEGVRVLGLTAGASAPEILVKDVVRRLSEMFEVRVEEIVHTQENIVFNLPRVLR